MKLARFSVCGQVKCGVIDGDQIIEISGSLFEAHTLTRICHRLSDVKLLAPVQSMQSFGPGLNFAAHLNLETGGSDGRWSKLPEHPEPWHKSVSAIVGPGDPILIPYDSPNQGVQHEGECVAVIGKPCRRVSPDEAWSHILGYTCGNDVSERYWQKNDFFYWRAKGSDTFAPMGPWIETEIDPRSGLNMSVRLNGRLVQQASTKEMLFDFGEIISYISQSITLAPGDTVWSGTTGRPEIMKPGDVVEVDIDGIGVLRNPVSLELRPAGR